MLIFRALNEHQLSDIENNIIYSSLMISDRENLGTNVAQRNENYDKCFSENRHLFYQLSLILGHTSGQLLKSGRSPWISLTKNFKVALNYATLQKCAYDIENPRIIVCFEIDDSKVLNYNSDMKLEDLKKVTESDYLLCLANGDMNNLYNDGFIPKISECENLIKNNMDRASQKHAKLRQCNYSYYDEELLAFKQVKFEDKLIFTPEEIERIIEDHELVNIIASIRNLSDLKEFYEKNIMRPKRLIK